MVLSPYYNDNDVVCQMRGFFDVEEQWNVDFTGALVNAKDYDEDHFEVLAGNRKFLVHKLHGTVTEVNA